jgi:hypothetical protein
VIRRDNLAVVAIDRQDEIAREREMLEGELLVIRDSDEWWRSSDAFRQLLNEEIGRRAVTLRQPGNGGAHDDRTTRRRRVVLQTRIVADFPAEAAARIIADMKKDAA